MAKEEFDSSGFWPSICRFRWCELELQGLENYDSLFDFFQGDGGTEAGLKKKNKNNFDSKQTVKFLASSSKFRNHTVPVCALAVCAQSMGVLPCSQQMLFVHSVHFGTHCVQSLVHWYITAIRDLLGRKGRVTLRRRKKYSNKGGD